MPAYRPAPERFEEKVYTEPNTGCHLFVGATRPFGYGVFNDGHRPVSAHIYAWRTANGPVPKGLCVLHKCDVPCCVNPDHLFLGSRTENNQDMARKWRGKTGVLPYGSRAQPRGGRFASCIQVAGVRHYLGTYDTAEEASSVAQAKKRELLNLP